MKKALISTQLYKHKAGLCHVLIENSHPKITVGIKINLYS